MTVVDVVVVKFDVAYVVGDNATGTVLSASIAAAINFVVAADDGIVKVAFKSGGVLSDNVSCNESEDIAVAFAGL